MKSLLLFVVSVSAVLAFCAAELSLLRVPSAYTNGQKWVLGDTKTDFARDGGPFVPVDSSYYRSLPREKPYTMFFKGSPETESEVTSHAVGSRAFPWQRTTMDRVEPVYVSRMFPTDHFTFNRPFRH